MLKPKERQFFMKYNSGKVHIHLIIEKKNNTKLFVFRPFYIEVCIIKEGKKKRNDNLFVIK